MRRRSLVEATDRGPFKHLLNTQSKHPFSRTDKRVKSMPCVNILRRAAQARLIDDRTRLEDKLQKARAEADHAKADQVRMARDVTTMFDELRAMADRHAELHADRARLQADVDRLAAELEQARRPWWWRLVGR
jgi:undecaprenyl pyrophosphate synthase